MPFSTEFDRMDNQNSIHRDQQYPNQIEDRLYDVQEITTDQYEGVDDMRTDKHTIFDSRIQNNENSDRHSSPNDFIVDSGDVLHSLHLKKSQNDDEHPSDSINIYEQNVISEDLTSSLPSLLQDSDPVDWNALLPNHSSPLEIESCSTSNLLLPHLVENQKESFHQLWSTEIDRTRLIDFSSPDSLLSILWSLISTCLSVLYSCIKILRYNTVLFGFCYLIGAFIGTQAYILLDSLLVITCFISIFVASYEKWLSYFVDFNDTMIDNQANHTDNENDYSRRIKLATYGFVLGTISTYII